jgi:hypothetical protein
VKKDTTYCIFSVSNFGGSGRKNTKTRPGQYGKLCAFIDAGLVLLLKVVGNE